MCEGRKTSQVDYPRTAHFDFFKKFKFLKSLEPKPGVIGCFFVTVSLICCLFLLDYRLVKGFHGSSFLRSWFKPDSSISKPGFLDISDEDCNIFDGNWVWDDNYPLYQPQGCMFLDEGFRCNENGRPDNFYTKWRWQPKDCVLPRFDGKLMLEKLRNKRVAFVGDSIGRNQWESLLCMLSSAVSNKSSIYEVNRNPITKHSGSLVFKFGEFNCTVEYHRAPFLVLQSRPPIGSKQSVKLTLKLDQMDWSSRQWKNADLLVLNTGHWWNYEKTIKVGCYFQEGTVIKEEMSIEAAFRRSMKTVMDWLSREVNLSATHLILRTYAPVHFSGGDWKNGGSCHRETMPYFGSTKALSEMYTEFKTMIEVFSKHMIMRNISLLNVTSMTSSRRDGHSSIYYLGPNGVSAAMNRQDCSHWCLPGVPDSWNELLYAVFLKREISNGLNQTKPMHSPG